MDNDLSDPEWNGWEGRGASFFLRAMMYDLPHPAWAKRKMDLVLSIASELR
jgi:hypothetical protein